MPYIEFADPPTISIRPPTKPMPLPAWLQTTDATQSTTRHRNWTGKNIRDMAQLILRITRTEHKPASKRTSLPIHPSIGLCIMLIACIINVCLQDRLYIYGMLAIILLRIAFLPVRQLARVLGSATVASLAVVFILLPAFIWGNPGSQLILIPLKSFITVAFVSAWAAGQNRQTISKALSGIHIPRTIILIIDQCLLWIVMLSRHVQSLFMSLEKRNVGVFPLPRKAISGIAGSTFIKSWQDARSMVQAMECRCFTGSNTVKRGTTE